MQGKAEQGGRLRALCRFGGLLRAVQGGAYRRVEVVVRIGRVSQSAEHTRSIAADAHYDVLRVEAVNDVLVGELDGHHGNDAALLPFGVRGRNLHVERDAVEEEARHAVAFGRECRLQSVEHLLRQFHGLVSIVARGEPLDADGVGVVVAHIDECLAQADLRSVRRFGFCVFRQRAVGVDIHVLERAALEVEPPVVVSLNGGQVAGVLVRTLDLYCEVHVLSGAHFQFVAAVGSMFRVAQDLHRSRSGEAVPDAAVGADLELFGRVGSSDGVIAVARHEHDVVIMARQEPFAVHLIGDDNVAVAAGILFSLHDGFVGGEGFGIVEVLNLVVVC